MPNKSKQKGPGTNPGRSVSKIEREQMAEQAKMLDKDRRSESKGGKILKGARRRAG